MVLICARVCVFVCGICRHTHWPGIGMLCLLEGSNDKRYLGPQFHIAHRCQTVSGMLCKYSLTVCCILQARRRQATTSTDTLTKEPPQPTTNTNTEITCAPHTHTHTYTLPTNNNNNIWAVLCGMQQSVASNCPQ